MGKGYAHEYYLKHKDKILARTKRYYLKNKTELNKKVMEWAKNNKEKVKINSRRWRNKNKKYIKEYNCSYRVKNRDKIQKLNKDWKKKNKNHVYQYYKNYIKKNPQKLKIYRANAQYKRRAKCIITDITPQWLTELWNNTVYCVICNKKMKNDISYPNGKHLDHILPICVGGQHMKNNVRFICAECNLARPKNGSDLLQLVERKIG